MWGVEKGGNWGRGRELVVHFVEWTTSWAGKLGKGRNRGESREPVVHSKEWTTGWVGKAWKRPKPGGKVMSQWSTLLSGPLARMARPGKGRNRAGSREPVVHSIEWTTGWAGKAGKVQKPGRKS